MDMPDIPNSRPRANGFSLSYSHSATPTKPTVQINGQGLQIHPSGYAKAVSLFAALALVPAPEWGAPHS